jgi:hypothetical protein
MIVILICIAVAHQSAEGPPLDFKALAEAIREADQIRDMGFLFEGSTRFFENQQPLKDGKDDVYLQ